MVHVALWYLWLCDTCGSMVLVVPRYLWLHGTYGSMVLMTPWYLWLPGACLYALNLTVKYLLCTLLLWIHGTCGSFVSVHMYTGARFNCKVSSMYLAVNAHSWQLLPQQLCANISNFLLSVSLLLFFQMSDF